MKKICLYVLTLASLLLTSYVFANAPDVAGYKSTVLHGKVTAAPMTQPTNIVIINFSNYYLHAVIPGTTIDQPIESGDTGLITHPSYYGNTGVQILDQYNRVVLTLDLCHHAIVTIDGGPGVNDYRASFNDNYC